MPSTIQTAHIKGYSSAVFHLLQQQGSVLRIGARNEIQKSKADFWDRIGLADSQELVTRHSDTPLLEIPHSRRMNVLKDYVTSTLFDNEDKIRMLFDPTSDYIKAQAMKLGRDMDLEFLRAASATAAVGEEGSSTTALPNTQKLASVTSAGTAGANLNFAALRKARKKMRQNFADQNAKLYCAVNAEAIDGLLQETVVTSADYNSMKPLVDGGIATFMGFTFIHTELLLEQSGTLNFSIADAATGGTVGSGSGDADGYKKIICWAEGGILLATAEGLVSDIGVRRDKNMAMQAYSRLSVGAVRMQEEQVVEILCYQP
jgi:hypothetical protein